MIRDAARLPGSLVIAEEKELVLPDWAAQRSAELLEASIRKRVGWFVLEGIASLLPIAPPIIECRAVKIVRTGLGLDSDHAGDGLAKFRVVILQRHFCFLNRIEVRIDDNDAENRILVIGSVEFERGAAKVLAVYENLLAALRIFCRCVAPPNELLGSR